MKTFKDLEFNAHSLSAVERFEGAKQATYTFENNYGVSVLFGNCFYSNGIDTYELAVLFDGNLCYTTDITSDVLAYITEDEVTSAMIKIQNLKNK
jgi:hypothetical protein